MQSASSTTTELQTNQPYKYINDQMNNRTSGVNNPYPTNKQTKGLSAIFVSTNVRHRLSFILVILCIVYHVYPLRVFEKWVPTFLHTYHWSTDLNIVLLHNQLKDSSRLHVEGKNINIMLGGGKLSFCAFFFVRMTLLKARPGESWDDSAAAASRNPPPHPSHKSYKLWAAMFMTISVEILWLGFSNF